MQAKLPKKKKDLLETAKRLMIRNGFVATTIDEICNEAKVTKGSFYYYFKSKEDLGKVLVEQSMSCCAPESLEKELGQIKDPLDQIYAYLDFSIQMSHDDCMQECLIGVFAQELSESHPEIHVLCQKSFEEGIARLKSNLTAAKEKHTPNTEIDLEGLAESFVAAMQGSLILMKVKNDPAVMERTLSHFKRYLESLFGHPATRSIPPAARTSKTRASTCF